MNESGSNPRPSTPVAPAATVTGAGLAVPPALTSEQLAELDNGRRRWKKIQRAVRVANSSAWTMAIIAGIGLLIGIFDTTSAIMGLLLAAIAVNEFLGAAKLKQARYVAPILLGWNQLLLIGIIGAYCLYSALQPSELEQQLQDPNVRAALQQQMPGISSMLEQSSAHSVGLNAMFYAIFAMTALVSQGLLALYYFSRRKHVLAYLKATPAWVVEVQRRAA